MKVLLCGERSFVATELYEKLLNAGFQVDCFSRGPESRNGTFVKGDVFKIHENSELQSTYDVVLNFIYIKDGEVTENLMYIESLVKFCSLRDVKHLIHISSIIVYNNKLKVIDEGTGIERTSERNGYAEVKLSIDHYLLSLSMQNIPFKISFVRPGYVIHEKKAIPFIKKLPFNFALLLGNKHSILPIVERNDIHTALINLINFNPDQSTYLFVPSNNKTKFIYAKEHFRYNLIILPRKLILFAGIVLKKIRLINPQLYFRIEAMFSVTNFNSQKTETLLKIKF